MVNNTKKILECLNKHKDDRCFIIGTGPSLLRTNLSLLDGEICFGVNHLYKSMGMGLQCQYYGVGDPLEWEENNKWLTKIKDLIIFTTNASDNCIGLKVLNGFVFDGNFSKDIIKGINPGGSVVISICIQVAYYMGFSEVYLLGCDCDYSNYRYFDKREPTDKEIKWLEKCWPNNPQLTNDWDSIFKSYKVCRKVYEDTGRKLINATVGGRLDVLKRERLEDII